MDIKGAISRADKLESKIDHEYMATLQGLSSPRVRHLLNNLAAQADSYLEVGCYLGGTLKAAMYKNDIYAAAIDNFSMSPATKEQFYKNIEGLPVDFFECDSFSFDIKKLKKPISLYFFDGCHSVEAQYKAISHFLPALSDDAIIVIDDWDMNKVRVGTNTALIDLKIKPIEKYELKGASGQSEEKRHLTWWGGLAIFKILK